MTRGLMFNHLPRENVDPISSTTYLRGISYTRHDTIVRSDWGAWSVNCVVANLIVFLREIDGQSNNG